MNVPSAILIARFRWHYQDGTLWRSPEYPTRDHIIPFGLFWLYLEAIPRNMALARLSETRAINNALAMAFAKEGSGLPPQLQRDQRDAYVAE